MGRESSVTTPVHLRTKAWARLKAEGDAVAGAGGSTSWAGGVGDLPVIGSMQVGARPSDPAFSIRCAHVRRTAIAQFTATAQHNEGPPRASRSPRWSPCRCTDSTSPKQFSLVNTSDTLRLLFSNRLSMRTFCSFRFAEPESRNLALRYER